MNKLGKIYSKQKFIRIEQLFIGGKGWIDTLIEPEDFKNIKENNYNTPLGKVEKIAIQFEDKIGSFRTVDFFPHEIDIENSKIKFN